MPNRSDPEPSHPGALVEADINRLLRDDPIGLKSASTAMAVPVDSLLSLVRGRANVTPILALKLARVLGTRTAAEWMALQAAYDLWRVERTLGDQLAALKPLR